MKTRRINRGFIDGLLNGLSFNPEIRVNRTRRAEIFRRYKTSLEAFKYDANNIKEDFKKALIEAY